MVILSSVFISTLIHFKVNIICILSSFNVSQ